MTEPALDWRRKHICDLAWVSREFKRDIAVPVGHRTRFGAVYDLAKRISSYPEAGNRESVENVVKALCGACKGAWQYECEGRSNWRLSCMLMKDRMRGFYD